MKITNLKEKLKTLSILVVLVAAMYLLKIPCPLNRITGIPCPGCGMTRAYLSLLRLDFAAAFRFNPMFWSVPILLLLYLFDGRLFRQKWINMSLTVGILSGFIVCWIIRLIGG